MSKLILASGSRFKQQQMARLDIEFESIPADIDESALPGEAPDVLAMRLAREKARELRAAHPDALILGGDQVISLDGEQLHKPRTAANARAQLAKLQGKTHDLFCAVALDLPDGRVIERMVHYQMQMRPLTEAAIARYVARDNPVDSAGSYVLEEGGVALFKSMRGDDYTAIIGLPLTSVYDMLEEAGFITAD